MAWFLKVEGTVDGGGGAVRVGELPVFETRDFNSHKKT